MILNRYVDEISESLEVSTGQRKKKRGRPKQNLNGMVMRDALAQKYEGDRVVPMYDGFDPINGGMTMLTPYEHKFAIVYTQTGDAVKSAEMAASDNDKKRPRNWRKVGYDLLRRPEVRQAIGFMQKKLCIAAALDSDEVISNIREIAALAMVEGKFEAALKANQVLGEFLGILGNNKPGPKSINVTPTSVIDVFNDSDELSDKRLRAASLSNALGLTPASGTLTPIRDVTPGTLKGGSLGVPKVSSLGGTKVTP